MIPVKRLSDLLLVLFPLIALVVVMWIFSNATDTLTDNWNQEQVTP